MCCTIVSSTTVHDICRLIFHHEINGIWKGQGSGMDFSVFALAWPSIPVGNLEKGTNGEKGARQMLSAAAAWGDGLVLIYLVFMARYRNPPLRCIFSGKCICSYSETPNLET